MSDEFDDSGEALDDGIFFAGIGAEDDLTDEVEEGEDALLADTKVRPDDESTAGSGMMPMLGAGAGGVGAAGLGAYVGVTRGDSKSRPGANAPVSGPVVSFQDVPDSADGPRVGADGRVLGDDPWGVGEIDDLPSAWGTASEEAPRTRATSGTRGQHLGRSETTPAMAPGATLGGVGGMQMGGQQSAVTATTATSQQGGIPLSVLQNLQSNKSSAAAFAPAPSGVSAAGAGVYQGDPALLVSQAIAAADSDGVSGNQDWLQEQLRLQEEQNRAGGVNGINPALLEDGLEDGEDEQGNGRNKGAVAGAAAAGVAGAAGAGGLTWWSGSGGQRDSGSAPVSSDQTGNSPTGSSATQATWGWNSNSGSASQTGFTGQYADTGVKPSGTSGFTPAGPGSSSGGGGGGGSTGGISGGGWQSGSSGGSGGGSGAVAGWTSPGQNFGSVPTASGTDFTVSQDQLGGDAEKWRRLAEEMDDVHAATKAVRDAGPTFGIISEPVRSYSRVTDLVQRWASQASHSYEELATQLNASAALYRANEQTAIDKTGRLFEA